MPDGLPQSGAATSRAVGRLADAAVAYIAGVLEDLAVNDLLNAQSPAKILARISRPSGLEEALKATDYVQENTPELLDVIDAESFEKARLYHLDKSAFGLVSIRHLEATFDMRDKICDVTTK